MRSVLTLVAFVGMLTLSAGAVDAQPARGQRPGLPANADDPGVSPAEIQRMFDAYALMQAQEQLKIDDAQFSQFLTRFKALQEVRRRTLMERTRFTNQLRRLLNQGQPDEAQLRERLKGLDELEAAASVDVKKAYDAIDQILDVRQQAKFRVFEENMERRKLDLVTRARQANRPKQQR